MKNVLRILFRVAMLLLLLAVVGGIGYALFLATRAVLAGAGETVAAAIVVAAAVLLSVIIAVYNQRRIKDLAITESHRPQKIEAYRGFMDETVAVLQRMPQRLDKAFTEKKTREQIEHISSKFSGDVTLFGSPHVIKAYGEFRRAAEPEQMLVRLDQTFRAMREDLGNGNWGLARGDLVSLFLSGSKKLAVVLEAEEG